MCEHKEFYADVMVNRLEDINKFNLDIKVRCVQCKVPFRFIGLPLGLNLTGPAMSPTGLEARLAIEPATAGNSPLDKMMAEGGGKIQFKIGDSYVVAEKDKAHGKKENKENN